MVRRADGIHAYQLAVAVDDAKMGITHVLRGADLLSSTPRQMTLLEALDLPAPSYFHAPLLLGPDGNRLSKRSGETTLTWYRSQGVTPERLVGALARSCGLTDRREIDARSLIRLFDPARLRQAPGGFSPAELFEAA